MVVFEEQKKRIYVSNCLRKLFRDCKHQDPLCKLKHMPFDAFFMLRTYLISTFKFFNGIHLLVFLFVHILCFRVLMNPFQFLGEFKRTSSWSFDEKLLIQSLYRVTSDAFMLYYGW